MVMGLLLAFHTHAQPHLGRDIHYHQHLTPLTLITSSNDPQHSFKMGIYKIVPAA
jgi:hypothetical protein